MTNEELVKTIQSGNNEAITALWDQTKGLAVYIMNHGSWNRLSEEPDLLQEAFLCMLDSVSDYDSGKGVKFASYYGNRLRWHWCRFIAQTGAARIPEGLFWKVLQHRRFISQYQKDHGREPSALEIADHFRITLQEARDLTDLSKKLRIRSLSEPVGGEEDDLLLGDMLQSENDPFGPVLEEIQNEQLSKELDAIIADLPELEAEAVRLKYSNGLTYQEIADQEKCTFSTAKSRCAAGLQKLRTGSYYRRIRNALKDDERFSFGLRGGRGSYERTGYSSTEYAAFKIEGWLDGDG